MREANSGTHGRDFYSVSSEAQFPTWQPRFDELILSVIQGFAFKSLAGHHLLPNMLLPQRRGLRAPQARPLLPAVMGGCPVQGLQGV